MGFSGALCLLMNDNTSLVDMVDMLQDRSDPKFVVPFVVIGIASRGLMACSSVYLLFALFGFNGESRRKSTKSAGVGLVKSP